MWSLKILMSLNDNTKILTKTDTKTFFPIPNFPKPKPILFFRDQIFPNRNRYFVFETKFCDTETDTFFWRPNFPKPKPRLVPETKFSETNYPSPPKIGKSLETETETETSQYP